MRPQHPAPSPPPADRPHPAALIAADWGTTSCRFALVTADGTVLERATGSGILPVLAEAERAGAGRADPPATGRADPPATGRAAVFEAELRRRVGPWLTAHPGIPVLMCGMIGSDTGWVDAGYRQVPCAVVVEPGALAEVPLEGHAARIVPGLLVPGTVPDIMRGEETQVLGALLEAGGGEDHVVIAPGTHSKWVRIRAGEVTGFRSYLTGELFTALREHTILGRGIPADADADPTAAEEAFTAGLDLSLTGPAPGPRGPAEPAPRPSPLHTVFSARTRVVAGDLDPAVVPAYLSGLLIGEEIADGPAATELGPDTAVTVIGGADLAERYRTALARAGITARVADPDTTLRGLLAVAEAAGWLTPERRAAEAAPSADPAPPLEKDDA